MTINKRISITDLTLGEGDQAPFTSFDETQKKSYSFNVIRNVSWYNWGLILSK